MKTNTLIVLLMFSLTFNSKAGNEICFLPDNYYRVAQKIVEGQGEMEIMLTKHPFWGICHIGISRRERK